MAANFIEITNYRSPQLMMKQQVSRTMMSELISQIESRRYETWITTLAAFGGN